MTILQRIIVFIIAFVLLNIPANVFYRVLGPYREWDIVESLKFTFFIVFGIAGMLGGVVLIAMAVSI